MIAIVTLALAACASKVEAPKKRPPPLVTVAQPTVRDVPVTLSYTVDIKPIEQADLQSKISGYVQKIFVDRGDEVKKGQVLAEVRPSELPEQMNVAREQVGHTEASYKLAEENVRRARELFKREMVSKADLDHAEAQLAMAQATRGSARASMGVVSTRLSETRLVAPFAGWVAKRYLDPGALVSPGQGSIILTLMRVDQVKVQLSVPETQAAQVRRGQTAQLTLDALPGKTFPATVTRVPPALDLNTRTLEVEIVIPNPDGTLKPGMYGRAALTVEVHPKAVVLPVDAVITEDKARAVYVVEDIKPAPDGKGPPVGKARRVVVETGFDGGDWLEITRGLTGEESVIVLGVDLAVDGQPVSVARRPDKPDRQARTPHVADPARAP